MSVQCIHAVTNITVEGLASETDGYSAVEEIPHTDGNMPLQDTSHSIVTLFLVSNFVKFPVIHKAVKIQEVRCASESLFIRMLCTLLSETV
jgi:hypothetical protein